MVEKVVQSQRTVKLKSGFSDDSIPDKIYFTIREVVELSSVKAHVIRYWETEFKALAPVRRRGNRRYYQKKDIQLIRQIRDLLYVDGYTVEGARQRLVALKKQKTVQVKRRDILDRIRARLHEIAAMLDE